MISELLNAIKCCQWISSRISKSLSEFQQETQMWSSADQAVGNGRWVYTSLMHWEISQKAWLHWQKKIWHSLTSTLHREGIQHLEPIISDMETRKVYIDFISSLWWKEIHWNHLSQHKDLAKAPCILWDALFSQTIVRKEQNTFIFTATWLVLLSGWSCVPRFQWQSAWKSKNASHSFQLRLEY